MFYYDCLNKEIKYLPYTEYLDWHFLRFLDLRALLSINLSDHEER